MSKSAAFKAACLGVTLATAWTAAKTQAATDFQITADCNLSLNGASVSLSQLTFVSGDLTIAVPDDSSGISALSGRTHWGGTIILRAADDAATKPWELIGLVGAGPAAGDVVVAFSDPSSAINKPFETVFSGVAESDVEKFIRSRASADIRNFLASAGSPVAQSFGSSSEVIQFSNGVDLGSITLSITPVPEPTGLALLATGAAAALVRGNRRKSK